MITIDPVLRRMLRTGASCSALMLAVVALLGYILNLPILYRWGKPEGITPPMAINTALAISCLALAQLLGRNDK